MGWHRSKSDPLKIYDSAHNVVARAENVGVADLIVRAVNEAANRELAAREPSKPLDMWTGADGCCASGLAAAGRSGVLSALTSWDCPRCGCNWKCTEGGNVRYWTAYPAVAVIGGRR